MNEEFEFEAFDEQPFSFETEEETEIPRGRRMPARGFALGNRAAAFKTATFRKQPRRPRPRPGIRFPPRFPIRGDQTRECDEQIPWVQSSLNRILNLNLPVDGVMSVETRSAVRSFQQGQNLPITGIVGPDTQQALMAATRGPTGAAASDAGPTSAAEPGNDGGGDSNSQSSPADESFEFYPEFGSRQYLADELFEADRESAFGRDGFGFEMNAQEWEVDGSRNSAGYIKWVQQALNKILGLGLAVDGISGPQTRSAIRSFQQRKGLVVDGIVGPKTEAALIAAGAGPPTGTSGTTVPAGTCPPKLTFVDCPVPGAAPTEVLDHFAFNDARLNRPRHTPQIINVARKIISSQSSRQPIRSLLIAGHTDPAGSDDFNFDLARRRAEGVARELCTTIERMRPGLARQVKFNLTSCGERQQKAAPEFSRRVEVFLPQTAPPRPRPPRPRPPRPRPPRPAPPPTPPTPRVPPDLELLIRLVRELLRSFIPILGVAGVRLPTTARFLTAAEQAEATTVFGASLDFSKILIADGTGFQDRPFTVAVPVSGSFFVVMLLGDLNPWHTRPRSHTLIHELTHAWQSQHAGDPTAFMKNSVRCQAGALADLPIAKAAAGAAASAAAVGRGVFDPIALARIAAAAAAAEDVSAYAYIPGRPFTGYAAEQIAQQVEDGHSGAGRPTPGVLTTIRSVSANVRSPANEASLGVTSFHRKSTSGVVFH
jgi:peptidoglycan hydrolase-like protein with peptidoglycan-binding domain